MVQILPLSPPDEKTRLMWKLSRMMILLSPATTDRGNTRVNFKWLSWKTLVFTLCYVGLLAAANLVNFLTGFNSQIYSLDQTTNIIDTGSEFAHLAVRVATITLPFIFASGLPFISGLALKKDLTSPNIGLVFILGSLLNMFAELFGNCLT